MGSRQNEQKWKSLNVLIAFVFSEVKDNVDGNGEDQNANTNTLTYARTHAKQRGKQMISYRAGKMLNGTFIIQLRFRSFEIMRIIQIETKKHVQVNSSAFNHSVIRHMLMVQYVQ